MSEPSPDLTPPPPRDLAGWQVLFDVRSLPILGLTSALLEDYREHEESVDAHLLAEAIAPDPLMTLKVLSYVGQLRRDREGSDPETLTAALVMLGVPPFFRAFGRQPTVEEHLQHRPDALEGFRAALSRSHRAAEFAIGFAIHRSDQDAPVIHEAALLHDFVELVLWLRVPHLALELERRLRADPALRSEEAQRQLLHIRLSDLQRLLVRHWCLPSLLVRMMDDRLHEQPQVKNVLLALRISRHSAWGWDSPRLADDVKEISSFLQLGIDPTWKLVRSFEA